MNLTTTYLGLKLRTPLVVSASPLSDSLDNLKRMEDAGAAAVVLFSLFEEQIRYERYELHWSTTEGTENRSNNSKAASATRIAPIPPPSNGPNTCGRWGSTEQFSRRPKWQRRPAAASPRHAPPLLESGSGVPPQRDGPVIEPCRAGTALPL